MCKLQLPADKFQECIFKRDELKPHYIQLLINGLLKAMKTTEPKTNWKWIKCHSEALKPSHRHISPMHGLLFLRCAENENIKIHLRRLKCCARKNIQYQTEWKICSWTSVLIVIIIRHWLVLVQTHSKKCEQIWCPCSHVNCTRLAFECKQQRTMPECFFLLDVWHADTATRA